jgi:hypothetical protein
MENRLPNYSSHSEPIPQNRRTAWYDNTFPTYADAFLRVDFYLKLSEPTLSNAGIGISLLGDLSQGCFGLKYSLPAMLGMQTVYTLYVVANSTFGATGKCFIPALLMGILQIRQAVVIAAVAAHFITAGVQSTLAGWRARSL